MEVAHSGTKRNNTPKKILSWDLKMSSHLVNTNNAKRGGELKKTTRPSIYISSNRGPLISRFFKAHHRRQGRKEYWVSLLVQCTCPLFLFFVPSKAQSHFSLHASNPGQMCTDICKS